MTGHLWRRLSVEGSLEGWPGGHGVDGLLDVAQLGCYGVELTRHGRERVQG